MIEKEAQQLSWANIYNGIWEMSVNMGNVSENNTLGFISPYETIMDSVYHMNYTFGHSSNSVTINFEGISLQGVGDESWGIDNVVVTPEPATILLLTLGGSVLRKRR